MMTGRTSVTVPKTATRAASRARSRWRVTSLFAHFCSQWIAGMRVRLVDHHRQGRLERVCKIADMGSGARDDIAVGIDQRVGLAGKWRHFDRKAAIETLSCSGTNRRKAIGNTIERRKSETDLERGNQ
jgi:hypothetical protein